MDVRYDPEVDAMYVTLEPDTPQSYTRSLDYQRIIDYAADGTPIGVELLGVKRGVDLHGLPRPEQLRKILERHNVRILEGQVPGPS